MKRREFLQTSGAAAVLPAIPVAATVAPSVPAGTALQLSWATHYARVHNAVSPDMLSSALGFEPGLARGIFERLLADKVITAPGAHGIARAVNPFYSPAMPSAAPIGSQSAAEGSVRLSEWLPQDDTSSLATEADDGAEAEVDDTATDATGAPNEPMEDALTSLRANPTSAQ